MKIEVTNLTMTSVECKISRFILTIPTVVTTEIPFLVLWNDIFFFIFAFSHPASLSTIISAQQLSKINEHQHQIYHCDTVRQQHY